MTPHTIRAAKFALGLVAGLAAPSAALAAMDQDKFELFAKVARGSECRMQVDAFVAPDASRLIDYRRASTIKDDRARGVALGRARQFGYQVRSAHKARVLEARWLYLDKQYGFGAYKVRISGMISSDDGWIVYNGCL